MPLWGFLKWAQTHYSFLLSAYLLFIEQSSFGTKNSLEGEIAKKLLGNVAVQSGQWGLASLKQSKVSKLEPSIMNNFFD